MFRVFYIQQNPKVHNRAIIFDERTFKGENKITTCLLTGTTMSGVGLSESLVSAKEVDRAETQVGIGFTGHGGGVKPRDLEVKRAPLNFDFGSSNTVNTATSLFNEQSGSNKHIVVKDQRGVKTDK